jgi:hypothetical protein
MIWMPSPAKTASNMPVNFASRSRIMKCEPRRTVAEFHDQVPGLLGDPPRQLLSLDQLGAHAAASQSAT